MRKVHNEWLDYRFELSEHPRRVVSLVSSATEALVRMGLRDRLVGISEYCPRYIDAHGIPVVGQYLNADMQAIEVLDPDLILLTTGVQRGLSKRLMNAGLPVYNLDLPVSFYGVLENIRRIGSVVNDLSGSERLISTMRDEAESLRKGESFQPKPRVYVELWLGRHRRAVGGMSYIADIVRMAGAELAFSDLAQGYVENDLGVEPEADIFLFFHEPEYLVDGAQLVYERGWDTDIPVIMSTVKMGENMIQEGPSLLETSEWLHQRIKGELR
ncbi:helical backbone metal receptor [Rubritalea sp.]|uniref:helical backbone metal receptor n=1 Tax=Rubritalea sp. TaxID=2109375 RepID=UPI0032425166